jgi:hypothetical protein
MSGGLFYALRVSIIDFSDSALVLERWLRASFGSRLANRPKEPDKAAHKGDSQSEQYQAQPPEFWILTGQVCESDARHNAHGESGTGVSPDKVIHGA